MDALLRAYPDQLESFDGTYLLWRDGTRMKVDDGRPDKSLAEQIRDGSLLDQMRLPYPAGAPLSPPPQDDPGRVRNRAFFEKMYGDCHAGEVTPKLVRIVWLPKTWGHAISITSVNGVDRHLAAVSRELDALPAEDKTYLYPIGGTYACRAVADTGQTSMHAWGAAIDINVAMTNYWAWGPQRRPIPSAIVEIFRRHGFIWGGDWKHFDTMHFEYRPELLPDYVASRSSVASSASPIAVVPTGVQPGAITSGVRKPEASTSAQARSTSAASSSSPNE
jgi:hypothetical protein